MDARRGGPTARWGGQASSPALGFPWFVPVDEAAPVAQPLPSRRRRETLDFSDYLELRRFRDLGVRTPELLETLAYLEERLPVPFARSIPDLRTLEDAPEPPPRELTREALRVAFALREEFAQHGATRMGLRIDLPEGRGLKSWLDFMETERRLSRVAREHLRELDGKIWTMLAGSRRPPSAPAPPSWVRLEAGGQGAERAGVGVPNRQGLYERQRG